MRREGTLLYTLIAEQVFCTKQAEFSFAPPGHRHLIGLYRKMFVLPYNYAEARQADKNLKTSLRIIFHKSLPPIYGLFLEGLRYFIRRRISASAGAN